MPDNGDWKFLSQLSLSLQRFLVIKKFMEFLKSEAMELFLNYVLIISCTKIFISICI